MEENISYTQDLINKICDGDYESAMNVIDEEGFDPNDEVEFMHMPIATYLSELCCDLPEKERESVERIIYKIIDHEKFDVNKIDDTHSEYTLLMRLAREEGLHNILDKILERSDVDYCVRNSKNVSAMDLALSYGNYDFIDKIRPKIMPTKNLPSLYMVPNSYMFHYLERGFEDNKKEGGITLYNLVKNFILKRYDKCIEIISSEKFNMKETDRWGEPPLQCLVYFSQYIGMDYDIDAFKEIVNTFISRKDFNVNELDFDLNTLPMIVATFPKLNSLNDMLFKLCVVDTSVKNGSGLTIFDIAEKNHSTLPATVSS